MTNLFSDLHVLEECTSDRFQSSYQFDVAMMDICDSQQVLLAQPLRPRCPALHGQDQGHQAVMVMTFSIFLPVARHPSVYLTRQTALGLVVVNDWPGRTYFSGFVADLYEVTVTRRSESAGDWIEFPCSPRLCRRRRCWRAIVWALA